MNWYIKAIKNYCNFSGRASRKEYWMFVLLDYIFTLVLAGISGLTGITIFIFYGLFMIVPRLSALMRRLHDVEKKAWWLLLSLIPGGGFVLLVFLAKPGTIGSNAYGADPRVYTCNQ